MNNYFDPRYSDSVMASLRTLYDRIILYLPNVIIALIVLILGWIIGTFLGNLVKKLFEMAGIDKLANSLGLDRLSQRSGRNFSIAWLADWVVKWFFFLASFIAAADILGLDQVTQFFYNDVLSYAGHVIVAMAIMTLGLLAANFFGDIVDTAVHAGGLQSGKALASITRWAILAFTVIAVLSELQIAQSFMQDLFRAVVAMLAIAGGLAFGLGGKEHAKKVLDSVEGGLTRRV